MSKKPSDYSGPLSVLEIHLDKVAANYLRFRKMLKQGSDCAAVVKADGYGLGAQQVARALFAQECRHFFVAHFDEGVAVRTVLPKEAVIYVLNGPYGGHPQDFTAQGLIPVLNSLDDIVYWGGYSAVSGRRQPAVIHIDTGMNRLGLCAKDVTELTRPMLQPIDIRYVMSHLSCADEPNHPMNALQLSAFRQLSEALGMPFRLSLANSAGILLGPDYHFDLARPGCGLYGINPAAGANPMDGVVTLSARIVETRFIDISSPVGYGASYTAASPAHCATISVGYADGYLRSLTGRGKVVIDGEKCPVIGRVSMDSIIVDTSLLPRQPEQGEWAEIIGPRQTVDEVAAQAGTIGYEILTSLGRRYRREYTGVEA
ncbi:MAG TPA: alanine racemase [Patescibacteria group bacterium]|nr:alanine racemase [Patescibacteria group bacterium]